MSSCCLSPQDELLPRDRISIPVPAEHLIAHRGDLTHEFQLTPQGSQRSTKENPKILQVAVDAFAAENQLHPQDQPICKTDRGLKKKPPSATATQVLPLVPQGAVL